MHRAVMGAELRYQRMQIQLHTMSARVAVRLKVMFIVDQGLKRIEFHALEIGAELIEWKTTNISRTSQ